MYFSSHANNLTVFSMVWLVNIIVINSSNRNRFLNREQLNISIVIHQKNESINVIKFIGRQHFELTDLMDQLNFCFSLQVYFDWIWNDWNLNYSISMKKMFVCILDNDQCDVYVWLFCACLLLILSIPFSTKSIL